jgi:ABC-type antimicrobial peptide transport system permease subunit
VKNFAGSIRMSEVHTERELAELKLAPTRYIAIAWAAFGGIALLLTSIGLYGLLSHNVSRRTNEIGIRMALGARWAHVVRLVMTGAFIPVCGGLFLGLALSLAINALMQGFIYGVKFNDPLSLLVAGAVMLAVTAVAGYLPIRRATGVDPAVALRHE